jgi:glutathione peroxidase
MQKITALFIFYIASVVNVWAVCPDYLDVDMEVLRSKKTINICENFGNNPILIVNTASNCGFTPQFKGMESLYKKYKDQGLVVLGFSSNSFKQEAKTKEETAKVCYINYGVTFQMFTEVSVRGENAHPIFKELARQSSPPSWNFNKYLIDKNGNVVKQFDSTTDPDAAEMHELIENVL